MRERIGDVVLQAMLLWILAGSCGSGAVIPPRSEYADRSVLAGIREEAETLREREPDRWANWDSDVDAFLAAYRARYAEWKNRKPPPPADLSKLLLPLAYLCWNAEREEPPLRFNYIAAIVVHPDPRRMEFLLDRFAQDPYQAHFAVDALTSDRAVTLILRVLAESPPVQPGAFSLLLIDRFASDFSPRTRRQAYEYVRRSSPDKVTKGGCAPLKYFRTLFRLDVERARREVLPLYEEQGHYCRFEVVKLLSEFAGPSVVVAEAARKWLEDGRPKELIGEISGLRILLLKSDPAGEAENFAKSIWDDLEKIDSEQWELRSRAGERVDCLLKTAPGNAVAHLRRFVGDARVADIHRLHVMEYLVRSQDPHASALVDTWLRNEPDHVQNWLRDSLAQWGHYGEQLAKLRHPNALPR